ncbi:hypothetical protein Holit_01031 [Hollandina sp. SP2]
MLVYEGLHRQTCQGCLPLRTSGILALRDGARNQPILGSGSNRIQSRKMDIWYIPPLDRSIGQGKQQGLFACWLWRCEFNTEGPSLGETVDPGKLQFHEDRLFIAIGKGLEVSLAVQTPLYICCQDPYRRIGVL